MTTSVIVTSTGWTQVSVAGAFTIHHTKVGGNAIYSRMIEEPVYLMSGATEPDASESGLGMFYCDPLEDWVQQDREAGPWWVRLAAGSTSDRWLKIAVESSS